MRRPSGPEAALRRDLLAFYRGHWLEGRLPLCEEATLQDRARRLLPGAAKRTGLGGLAAGPGKEGRLAPALGFLELLCVHLALAPWRKEARSLKTFTGNFVYYVRSVLPEEVVERLLEKIGYVATTATEFTLIRKLNQEEAEQAAFELFLARIECENLLEVAEDANDRYLGDLQQERAQEHWSLGEDLDKKHQPIQSKEYVSARGQSEAQDEHGLQETYLTQSALALKRPETPELRSEVSHRSPTEDLQTAISRHFPEQNTNQRSGDVSSNICVKSSDSEDFLIKYSDIVIGQKPLHLTDLSPKASANETRAKGVIETRLGPASNGASATLLSPDASGPQALAILNNGTLGNHRLYDYRTQETDESKICNPMNCLSIYGADPTDQPKELKGNTVQHSNMHTGCNLPRQEDARDLFCHKKLKIKLMYPVEETTQLEQRTSRSAKQESNLSRMKLADQPGRNREDFNINSYSSPDLFCNITGCECAAVDSAYNKLVARNPGASGAGETFRNVGEHPTSSYTVTPEALEHGSLTTSLQCKREGCPLHSSFANFGTCLAPVSETNPEGYVIVNKDD